MKVCVAGLGAVGGLLAARLAQAGHEVSALARGATLAAVRERGLVLTTTAGDRVTAALRASDRAADLGTADLLIVAGQNPGTNHPRMLSALEKAKRNGATIVADEGSAPNA